MKKVSVPLTIALLAILYVVSAAPTRAGTNDSVPPVCLVMYAFGEEGRELASHMTVEKQERILGRTVSVGTLAGRQVILAGSGVGMTNAAMSVQRLVDEFHPTIIVFSGIAGAIDSSVHVGDIVVASQWVQHDYGYVGPKGFEIDTVWAYSGSRDTTVGMTAFSVDERLLGVARLLLNDTLALDSIGVCKPRLTVGGVGATGNAFIDSKEKREWLTATLEAKVVDMESAAIAQVATSNGIPFLVFRSASDLAGGSGSATAEAELNRFFKVAAKNSATVVMRFLERLPARMN
jgi:adenosylhomocysteine nucleosidase